MNIPESKRPFNTPKNPHSWAELWKHQDDRQELENMKMENWYPHSRLNIYNQETFVKPKDNIKSNTPVDI